MTLHVTKYLFSSIFWKIITIIHNLMVPSLYSTLTFLPSYICFQIFFVLCLSSLSYHSILFEECIFFFYFTKCFIRAGVGFCLFSTFSSPGRFLVSSKISLLFASFFDSWHGIILAFHVIPFTKYSFNRIMQKAWSNANQVCMLVGFIIDGTA